MEWSDIKILLGTSNPSWFSSGIEAGPPMTPTEVVVRRTCLKGCRVRESGRERSASNSEQQSKG